MKEWLICIWWNGHPRRSLCIDIWHWTCKAIQKYSSRMRIPTQTALGRTSQSYLGYHGDEQWPRGFILWCWTAKGEDIRWDERDEYWIVRCLNMRLSWAPCLLQLYYFHPHKQSNWIYHCTQIYLDNYEQNSRDCFAKLRREHWSCTVAEMVRLPQLFIWISTKLTYSESSIGVWWRQRSWIRVRSANMLTQRHKLTSFNQHRRYSWSRYFQLPYPRHGHLA